VKSGQARLDLSRARNAAMHVLNGNAGQKFSNYFCSIFVRALRQAVIRAARLRGFSSTNIMLWPKQESIEKYGASVRILC